MHTMAKTALSILLGVSFVTPTDAQEQPVAPGASPKSPCETIEHFNDFDFWLGEWSVYSNDEKHSFQGTNTITKHHKNCLIMENWTNAQGGTGSSMNYYDAVEDLWRQLWVAGGYSIDYTGSLDASGAMVLTGKINYYKTGESLPFRGRWSANADGSVRQFFEQKNPQTGDWAVWFDGHYVRR